MRIVLQRVSQARVTVDGETTGEIGRGLLLLVGLGTEDGEEEIEYWVRRVPELRIFPDEQGRMNRSVMEVGGGILAVPNFTLYAEVSKGRRPGFGAGAKPERAAALFERFTTALGARGVQVEAGRFGEHMEVALVNDGPVTLILDDAAVRGNRE
ncbi:MAG: D-tyrosyl-tRNA(Tyr) deacylase [candidate division WS1 bacterium]|jgi:D-tyrosyl-tRNA(Tyr) deacylase|nr:D-tyrosyl-tRNA(Tyr) deacylase [candidate division WS1 bacterium]